MSDLLVRVSGACGRITLNRPRALNAMTLKMVGAMHSALVTWAGDASIRFVLVDGAGDRGLCAGGDIRALYNAIVSRDHDFAVDFFQREYRLNYLVATYPKPYIALMDGIVMGGGIGISAHASHRVVTERSELAMPETAIGFVPDVGGTYLLGAAPDELGTYLGLTGNRVGPADAIFCGLADSTVPGAELPALTRDLEQCGDPAAAEECLRARSAPAPAGMSAEVRAWIGECFAADTVEAIIAALTTHAHPEANATALELLKRSPTSLKVTLSALRKAKALNALAPCLLQEYRVTLNCLRGHDFAEGIRAAIIDKDRRPTWRPDRLEPVTGQDVERYFISSEQGELDLASLFR